MKCFLFLKHEDQWSIVHCWIQIESRHGGLERIAIPGLMDGCQRILGTPGDPSVQMRPDASRFFSILLKCFHHNESLRGENLPLPIIFKAAFGGGGRGMRNLVQTLTHLESFSKNCCWGCLRLCVAVANVKFLWFLAESKQFQTHIWHESHIPDRTASEGTKNQANQT